MKHAPARVSIKERHALGGGARARSAAALLAVTLLLTFLPVSEVAGTTILRRSITCPICGHKFTKTVIGSMTTTGRSKDFQRRGFIGNYYAQLVHACPKCHFAGTLHDFVQPYSAPFKKRVRAELYAWSQRIDEAEECLIAAEIYGWQKRPASVRAHLLLVGSYLLRGSKGLAEVRRRAFQEHARVLFVEALKLNQFAGHEGATIRYLVGELYRRTDRFKDALSWYKKALASKQQPPWLKKIVEEQKKLAAKRDANNDI